jgi:hypothetical protein
MWLARLAIEGQIPYNGLSRFAGSAMDARAADLNHRHDRATARRRDVVRGSGGACATLYRPLGSTGPSGNGT